MEKKRGAPKKLIFGKLFALFHAGEKNVHANTPSAPGARRFSILSSSSKVFLPSATLFITDPQFVHGKTATIYYAY